MADINTYALGLEFQMQIEPALASIDRLLSATEKLQSKLVKTSDSLSPTGDAIIEWQMFAKPIEYMDLLVGNLEQQYVQLMTAEQNLATSMFNSEEAATEAHKAIFKLKHGITETEEAITKLKKEWKEWPKLFDEQRENMSNITADYDVFKRSVDKQRDAIKAQNAEFSRVFNTIMGVTDETKQLNQVISAAVGPLGLLSSVLVFLGIGLRDVIKMQDAYAKLTFVAIGGQEAMIDSTNKLRASVGATTEESIRTLKALAEAGFRAEHDISTLADTTYKFSIATGVSEAAAAKYQRQIVAIGGNATLAKQSLATFAAVIKSTGLTAAEAEGLMSGFNRMMLRMRLFGKSTDDFAKTSTELGKLAGAFKSVGGSATSVNEQFDRMITEPLEMVKALGKLNIEMDENASTFEQLQAYLKGTSGLLAETTGMTDIERQKTLEARGVNADFAASFLLLQDRIGNSEDALNNYVKTLAQQPDLDKAWRDSTATLTKQLQQILVPILTIATTIGSILVPALTKLAEIISYVTTGFGQWWKDLQDNHPNLSLVISILATGIGVAIGLGAAIAISVKWFGSLVGMLKGVLAPFKAVSSVMAASKTAAVGAGTGVKSFMINFAEGLKAMGSPQAMKGAITLGILAVMVGGTLLLMAIAMKEFGLSAKDMLAGAAALVIAAGAMVVMAYAVQIVSKAGPQAALGAAILIGVVLALGAATLMAGIGMGLMAKGFAELFKAIPDITTFLVVIGGLVIAMPTLAVGIAFLGLSIMASAPFILMGFGMLFASAMLALIINPIFAEFAGTISLISTSLNAINPNMGMALLDLAAGITGFMFALMGIAAGGAVSSIGSLFGVKSPLKQAEEIADAMRTIAEPAAMLSGAVGRIATIGDVFKPFVDSILGRRDEIAEAAVFISSIASQLESARKTIDGTTAGLGLVIPIKFAEPVRKPIITEDTARNIREERNQSNLVRGTEDMKTAINKVSEHLENSGGIAVLTELLKVWLPKIAKPEDTSPGLSSAANQWM